MRLPQETVCRILHCLVEGNSVRGTARLCGEEKQTVLNILKLAGESCERILTKKIHNVKVPALHFAHYNLCRIHGSLRGTPAMAAGVADHVWSISELIGG